MASGIVVGMAAAALAAQLTQGAPSIKPQEATAAGTVYCVYVDQAQVHYRKWHAVTCVETVAGTGSGAFLNRAGHVMCPLEVSLDFRSGCVTVYAVCTGQQATRCQ